VDGAGVLVLFPPYDGGACVVVRLYMCALRDWQQWGPGPIKVVSA
jgi:hypothetical protein